MEDLKSYRNRIIKYAAIAGLVFWLGSLPFAGVRSLFLPGLLLGYAVSAVNFFFLAKALERSLSMAEDEAKKYVLKNYILRLLLYGAVFLLSLRLGLPAALGSLAGICTTKAAIYADGLINGERL